MNDDEKIARLEAIVADPAQASLHDRAKAGLAKLRTHAPREQPPAEREREAIGLALARARGAKVPEGPSAAETAGERFSQTVTGGGLRPVVALGAAIRESREGEPGKQVTSLFDKFMEMAAQREQAGEAAHPAASLGGTIAGLGVGGVGAAGEKAGAAAARAIPDVLARAVPPIVRRLGTAATKMTTAGGVVGGAEAVSEAALAGKSPSEMARAGSAGATSGAKAGATFSPLGALLGAAGERIRDPRTPRGRNLQVLREAKVSPTTLSGGRAKDIEAMRFPTGGLSGSPEPARMGAAGAEQVGVRSAENIHKAATQTYQDINRAFGQAEQMVLAKNPTVTVPATGVTQEFLDAAASKEFRGMPLDAEDVKFFDEAAAKAAQGPLSLQEAVKLRRALDDRAHMNRLATKDDVPYRQASELLRGEIAAASPELGAMYRQHHDNLSRLEDINEHLFGKSVAATEESPNIIDRAAKRLARLKEEGGSRKVEQEILRIGRENPSMTADITAPAVKTSMEQMRFGKWSPAYTGTGMVTRNVSALADPLLGRFVEPGTRGAQSMLTRSSVPIADLYAEIARAAREKRDKKKPPGARP